MYFCTFFCHRPTMNRLCVIRDSSPNQYMLLITFKDKVKKFFPQLPASLNFGQLIFEFKCGKLEFYQYLVSWYNILYMQLLSKIMSFFPQSSADQFYTSYNCRLYNSMEKTVCQLVFVKKVELRKSSQGGSLPSAGMTELPSCPVCLEKLVSWQTLMPL